MKKFNEFSPIMKQHFIDNYNNNMNTIDKEIKYLSSSLTLPKHASNYIISTNIYHMTINIDYPELKIKFDNNRELNGVKRKFLDISLAKSYNWKPNCNLGNSVRYLYKTLEKKFS